MWWLACVALASAGEISVQLSRPVVVAVDGAPLALAPGSLSAVARGLGSGSHEVTVHNLLGKVVTRQTVAVGDAEQVRLVYRARSLTEVGRGTLSTPPPEPAPPGVPAMPVVAEAAPSPPAVTAPPAAPAAPTVVQTDAHVGGQVAATSTAVAGPSGATLAMEVVDPVTGERISAGVSVGVTGFGLAGPSAAPAAPAGPQPLSAADFAALRRAMDDASFSDDKLDLLRTAVAHSWLTCAQLGQLLDTFSHASDRVEAVQVAAPRVVDKHNAHQLDQRFTFSSDKSKVQALFR